MKCNTKKIKQAQYYCGTVCNLNSSVVVRRHRFKDLSTTPSHLCLLWTSGMFDLPSSIGSSSTSYAKSSDLIPLFFNEDISMDNNTEVVGVSKTPSNYSDGYFFRYGRWTHKILGAPPWLSFYGMKIALEGYHFIFRGDSMMRQIFNRLVFHVRGYDTVIEHFYHLDATYTFNTTHDLLAIDYDDGIVNSFSVENALFTASFIWDPTLDREDSTTTTTTAAGSSLLLPANALLVVGLHYWYPFAAEEKRLLRFNSSQTIFVTTPNLFGDEDFIYKKAVNDRNEWIRRNGSGNYIPLDAMARDGAFHMNREDSMHFQCSYLSRRDGWNGWMERVAVLNNEIQFKAPASGDCRDMVNLNVLMLLVNYCTTNATTATRASKK